MMIGGGRSSRRCTRATLKKGFEMRRFLQIKSFARTYLKIGLRKDVEGKFIL